MNASIVKLLGWTALALSALLMVGTVWVYGMIQQSLAALPASLSQTTAAAAEALAALAATTVTRADIAADTIQTLSAAQSTLAKVKAAAERQVSQLPHHEATIRAIAANTMELSRAANRVADVLSQEVPLLKSRPLEPQARVLRPYADTLAKATISLNDAADSVKSDALPFAKSIIDLSVAGAALAEHARRAAEAVKSQHLPQLASTLEQAASTLKQASAQASVVAYLPLWVLILGICISTCLALVGVGLLTVAATLGPKYRVSATINEQAGH